MREWADWFCALFVTAALSVALLGAAESLEARRAAETAGNAAADGAYIVAVDAGHGGMDGGAVGTDSGVIEATLNLDVAKRVEAGLAAQNVRVVMTRTDDDALAATKQGDLRRRREIIAESGADLVVSVHMNSFQDRSVSGAMAYYMLGSEAGQRLAQIVIDALTDALDRPRRLANPGDYFIIRECACPAVLVECGFLTNPEDEQNVQTPEYRQTLADAIVSGVLAYFAQTEPIIPQNP